MQRESSAKVFRGQPPQHTGVDFRLRFLYIDFGISRHIKLSSKLLRTRNSYRKRRPGLLVARLTHRARSPHRRTIFTGQPSQLKIPLQLKLFQTPSAMSSTRPRQNPLTRLAIDRPSPHAARSTATYFLSTSIYLRIAINAPNADWCQPHRWTAQHDVITGPRYRRIRIFTSNIFIVVLERD